MSTNAIHASAEPLPTGPKAVTVAERYLADRIAPALLPGSQVGMSPLPGGNRSLVYRIDVDGQPRFVLRAEGKRRSAARRVAGHRAVGAAGLRVPNIIWFDFATNIRRRYGQVFLLEEWLDGCAFSAYEDRSELAISGGRLFSQLHSTTSRYHGQIGRIRLPCPPLGTLLQVKSRLWLRRLAGHWLAGSDKIGRWLSGQPQSAWQQSPRLCQGDTTAQNIRIHDGELRLIDVSHASFASAAMELACIRQFVLKGDQADWHCFAQSYMKHAQPDLRAEVQRSYAVSAVLFHLRCAIVSPTADRRALHHDQIFQIINGNRDVQFPT